VWFGERLEQKARSRNQRSLASEISASTTGVVDGAVVVATAVHYRNLESPMPTDTSLCRPLIETVPAEQTRADAVVLSPQRLAAADTDTLCTIGLTNAKAATLHTVSQAVATGRVDLDALRGVPTEEAEATLVALPGIGP